VEGNEHAEGAAEADRSRRTNVRVALIGATGAILAALVGGVFAVNAGAIDVNVLTDAPGRDELRATVTSLEGEVDVLTDQNKALQTRLDATDSSDSTFESDDPSSTTTMPIGLDLTREDPVESGGWLPLESVYIDDSLEDRAYVSGRIGYCSSTTFQDDEIEFALRGQHQMFRANLGLEETSDAGFPVRMTVIADGQEIYAKDIQVGTSEEVALPVGGVLRLKVLATKRFESRSGQCDTVKAAIGHPAAA
jgi:hypothetical protein